MRLKLAGALGLLALVLPLGCHHRLPKLAAQGKHAEVVERAERARFRPKRRAARAYAVSLHALGRDTQALDTLLLDYRRGGEVASLIALADLERTLGWRGLAAHHYARVLTHDRNALHGRAEVCGLFRERARAYLHAEEGEAADLDMRRVRLICGSDEPGDAALAAEADAAAQALVDARIESGRCPEPCETPDSAEGLEPALESARGRSPRAVAELVARQQRQLPPALLVEQLQAEAQGRLGLALLEDDTVRAWVGGQSWSDLAPAVMSAAGPVAAYAQLRLAPVLSDMPRAPGRAGDRELDRWTEQALRIPDVSGWRVYAAQGDITTAELSHASRWRPPKPQTAPDDPPPARVRHWSERLPIDAGTLEAALVAARLRKAAGKHDLALDLTLRALRAGGDAGIEAVDRLGRDAVIEAIGWGRPWHALALLDSGAVADVVALRAAAATAVVLARAMCDGSCREDEDLGTVTRIMGEDWVERTRASLLDWSLARRTRAAATRGCPTVAELTVPDAVGPLAEALRTARAGLDAPGVGEALAAAIASDLRSWCAADIALPAMVHGDFSLPAARLSDSLSHAPEMNAASDLVTHAKLSLVADQFDRGFMLATAAAGEAASPREVWLELARFAAETDARELELRALREALLLMPGATNRAIHQRMLLVTLGDVAVSWGQDLPQGKETTARHVLDFLDPTPHVQRWQAEHALLQAVLTDGLPARLDPDARARLVDALGGAETLEQRHPRALARLRSEATPAAGSGLHDEGMADDVREGRLTSLPPALVSLADPRSFEATRKALATSARDWAVRRRMAISLLAVGGVQARRVGWAALVEMASASKTAQAESLRGLIVQRPATVAPMWGRWAPIEPDVVLEGQADLVRVVLGLDLGPAPVAP